MISALFNVKLITKPHYYSYIKLGVLKFTIKFLTLESNNKKYFEMRSEYAYYQCLILL